MPKTIEEIATEFVDDIDADFQWDGRCDGKVERQETIFQVINLIKSRDERAAAIANKWAQDDTQKSESRLVASYITKDILQENKK